MMLVAIETGMRVGELAALRKEDIETNYIRVHRQQIVLPDDTSINKRICKDVEYTKNERANPKAED